jgi:hypothetical protein
MLKDAVQKKLRSKNQTKIWVAVEAKWKAIPQSKLESLVAPMLERIRIVLAVGSGHIH